MTRAGFIGLGSQGGGMAERLIDQGLETTLWARRPEALEPFTGRARLAADPAEVGRASDVVGICVTDGAAAIGALTVYVGGTDLDVAGARPVLETQLGNRDSRQAVLGPADRFLALVDHPRAAVDDPEAQP